MVQSMTGCVTEGCFQLGRRLRGQQAHSSAMFVAVRLTRLPAAAHLRSWACLLLPLWVGEAPSSDALPSLEGSLFFFFFCTTPVVFVKNL